MNPHVPSEHILLKSKKVLDKLNYKISEVAKKTSTFKIMKHKNQWWWIPLLSKLKLFKKTLIIRSRVTSIKFSMSKQDFLLD